MAFLRRIWNKWQNLLHDEKLKHKIYVIIFESDTPMGKLFDVALIGFIVLRWVLSIPFFISCIRQQNPLTVLSKIILRKVKQFNLPPPQKK